MHKTMDKVKQCNNYRNIKPNYIDIDPLYLILKFEANLKENKEEMSYCDLKACSELTREELRFLYFLRNNV